jgi:hypothetical protein
MRRPFDLTAAKQGEPVEVLYRGEWVPAHFVGLNSRGVPIFEGEWDAHEYSPWTRENIRMAERVPQKRTVWVNIYRLRLEDFDGNDAGAFDTEEQAILNAFDNSAGVIAKAVPIEIAD